MRRPPALRRAGIPHKAPADPPRRLLDRGEDSPISRLLAAAARPVRPPWPLRERVLATDLRPTSPGGWRRPFRYAFFGVTVAMLLFGVWRERREVSESGQVVTLAGAGQMVRADRAGQSPVPLTVGARLGDGETVWTAASGPLAVRLLGVNLQLAAETGVSFRRHRGGALDLGLIQGQIALSVEPRPPGQPVVVQARGHRVEVVGTAFTVRAPGTGPTLEVLVSSGVVRVRGPGTDRYLRAGERWSSAPVARAVAPSPPTPTADPAVPSHPAGPPTAVPPRPAAVSLAATGERRSVAARAAVKPVAAHTRQAPRMVAALPPRLLEAAPTPSADPPAPAGAAPPAAAVEPGATPPVPTPPLAPAPAAPALARPAPSEEERYETAQALVASARYREAAAAFERLAKAGGSLAELALYEQGRILLRRLEAPRQAAATFTEYRRRFPDGALRPDVELSLIDALLADGRLDPATRQIEAFLVAYPNSERRNEVRLLRAHIFREEGDCERAGAEYDRLANATAPTGEQALYYSAYCRQQLGDPAGARRRLARYLARFPRGGFAEAAKEALGAKP